MRTTNESKVVLRIVKDIEQEYNANNISKVIKIIFYYETLTYHRRSCDTSSRSCYMSCSDDSECADGYGCDEAHPREDLYLDHWGIVGWPGVAL